MISVALLSVASSKRLEGVSRAHMLLKLLLDAAFLIILCMKICSNSQEYVIDVKYIYIYIYIYQIL